MKRIISQFAGRDLKLQDQGIIEQMALMLDLNCYLSFKRPRVTSRTLTCAVLIHPETTKNPPIRQQTLVYKTSPSPDCLTIA